MLAEPADLIAANRAAEAFAKQHVVHGARELVEMMESGVLCEGVVRELANRLTWLSAMQRLTSAQRMFERAALRVAAGEIPRA